MRSPRERTLARIKTLAAAGGVVAACHEPGYGVVDPMPMPACFESPGTVVTAKLLKTEDDGSKLIELVVKFEKLEEKDATVGEVSAQEVKDGNSEGKLEITEQAMSPDSFRAVIRAPKGAKQITLFAQVKCSRGYGFNALLEIDDADNVKVKSAR